MAALTGGAPSSVRAMAPILAAPAVCELEGPIITGPSISKISSIEKLLSECVEGIVPHNAARDNGFVGGCRHVRLTKTGKRLIIHLKDAAINGRRLVTAPIGGDIHVLDAYIPYRRLFSLDQNSEAEKTKPPLCQVTVSFGV